MLWCMRRTNIYLDETQTAALDERARMSGISRAEALRRLIDDSIGERSHDVESDLAAIEASFAILADVDDDVPARGPDARAEHLDRIWRR